MKPRPFLPRSTVFLVFQSLLAPALAMALAVLPFVAGADPVDDLIAAEVTQRHVPAVSIAILHQGKLLRTAATGFANLEQETPASPATVFQIQSVTKTFTSAAILLLAEEGKLSLEDPVSKHLESTPDTWKEITLRHLLSHTSGIKDFINAPTASLRIEVTEEEVLRATAARTLNFTAGERYEYSNSNYHLLAMIVRKLTGKSYGEFLQERVFAPLGMASTRIVSHSDLIPHRASGYFWTGSGFRNGEFIAESILSYGGGGIVSTAGDLALWAQALLKPKLLKPESIAEAWTPARLKNGTASSYGLGWGIQTVAGHREIRHNGAHATGFTSCLAIYPEDSLAIAVLINGRGGNPDRLARQLAGLYIPGLTSLDGN